MDDLADRPVSPANSSSSEGGTELPQSSNPVQEDKDVISVSKTKAVKGSGVKGRRRKAPAPRKGVGSRRKKTGIQKVDQNQDWEVEKIMGKRTFKKQLQYKIKWVGYSDSYNSWEPVRHLTNCQEMLDEFEKTWKAEQNEKKRLKRKAVSSSSSEPDTIAPVSNLIDSEDDTANDPINPPYGNGYDCDPGVTPEPSEAVQGVSRSNQEEAEEEEQIQIMEINMVPSFPTATHSVPINLTLFQPVWSETPEPIEGSWFAQTQMATDPLIQQPEKVNVWIVEKIVSKGIFGGKIHYMVKWDGLPDPYNTWFSLDQLKNCQSRIDEYESVKL